MQRRNYYENKLAIFKDPADGYRHLAASVIEHAIAEADDGDTESIEFLLSDDAPIWAEFAGMDKEAVRDELQRRYS